MKLEIHQAGEKSIVEVLSEEKLINDPQEGLQLLADIYYQGYDRMILQDKNLDPDVFELKNGLLGEILQKFSNYRMRLAIVGDFSKYPGKSVRDFIYESNNGRMVNFVPTVEEAIARLSK